MSRKVIHDLVLPIVLKRLQLMGRKIPSSAIIHDEQLEDFFDEELSKNFSLIGQNGHCEELEERIKEAQERDIIGFQLLIHKLLERYLKLKTVVEQKKSKTKKKKTKKVIQQ